MEALQRYGRFLHVTSRQAHPQNRVAAKKYEAGPRRAMTDTDPITFGKYEGTSIGKVPSSYLLWLWNNGMYRETLSNRSDPVRLYIIENFHALETECPDTIIDHRP